MTEEQWLASTDPTPLLEFVLGKSRLRRRLLFAYACCSRVMHLLSEPQSTHALAVVERFIEGRTKLGEVKVYWKVFAPLDSPQGPWNQAWFARRTLLYLLRMCLRRHWEWRLTACASEAMGQAAPKRWWQPWAQGRARAQERRMQAALARDIFNPFARPFDPAWRTPTVVAIATSIYEEPRFGDLPVLADALEEVGAEKEVLEHLRRRGNVHVRGCWALDLVLDKK